MPDIVEAPVAPATTEGEASPTFDTAQLDAMLNQMRPMPADKAPVVPVAAPEPVALAAVTPEPVKAPVAVVEAPKPASPFDPPPSVLGEAPAPVAPAEDDYGTLPEEAPAEFKSNEAKASYAKMRENHERLKADLRSLREESKKAPPVDENMAAQLQDALARNAELNTIVERTSVESHPYVRQTFDEPRRQLFSIASKALEKVDVDPGTIGKILSLEGKARVEAMDELYGMIESPSTREKVTNAISQIDLLDEKKAEFLEDRKGNIERMTQAEKAERYRQMSEQETSMKTVISTVHDEIANKYGFPFLKKATEAGSEEWNKRVEQDEAWVEHMVLRNTDPSELVKAVRLGREAPYLLKAWQNERTAKIALEKKLAELEGALPNLEGGSAAEKISSNGTLSKDTDEMIAAGIMPSDSLAVQSRKLAEYWNRRG